MDPKARTYGPRGALYALRYPCVGRSFAPPGGMRGLSEENPVGMRVIGRC
jgi:hypothetical protein